MAETRSGVRIRRACAGAVAGLSVLVTLVGCDALDALGPGRDAACGAYRSPNRLVVAFDLADARDLGGRIPRLRPDRELPSEPALVVVFDGPGRDVEIAGGRVETGSSQPGGLHNVCLVLAHGSTVLYRNVDTSGLSP